MPSLPMSDSLSCESPKERSMKEKKSKLESVDSEKKIKKEKSSSKKRDKEGEKEKKKRKAVELDDSSDKSELVEPVVDLKPKKAKLMEVSDEAEEEEAENPNSLSNFRISKPLKDALISKGIQALFPIQAMTFDIVIDGCDLVARARTGQVCFHCFSD